MAVELGHGETVHLLVTRGADLGARLDVSHESMTALEMAEKWDLMDMVELLEPYYAA